MTEQSTQPMTWTAAIQAAEPSFAMPSFTLFGMGSLRTSSTAQGRFVTLKRRFVSASQATIDGAEWALWQEQDGVEVPVAAFREPVEPTPESVRTVLELVRGWLFDDWSAEHTQAAVAKHPRVRTLRSPTAVDAN